MSKNQSFLDLWAYIGLRALMLLIACWEILFESDEKCTPCTPEPLFVATALKPNTFKMMIYECFDFLVLFRVVSWAIHMIL